MLDRRTFDYVRQDVDTRTKDGHDPAVTVHFDDGQSCLIDGVASIRGREDQWVVVTTEEDETIFVPIERITRVTVTSGGRKRAIGFAVESVEDTTPRLVRIGSGTADSLGLSRTPIPHNQAKTAYLCGRCRSFKSSRPDRRTTCKLAR